MKRKEEGEGEEEKGKGVGREGSLSLGQAPPPHVPPAEEAEVRGESVKGLHLFPGLFCPFLTVTWEAASPLWPSFHIKQWGHVFNILSLSLGLMSPRPALNFQSSRALCSQACAIEPSLADSSVIQEEACPPTRCSWLGWSWVQRGIWRPQESLRPSLRWAGAGHGLGGTGCPVGGSDAHLRNSIPGCS